MSLLFAGVFCYQFFCKKYMAGGSTAFRVVEECRQTMAWSFAKTDIARNDSIEHHFGEMPFEFLVDLIGEAQSGIVHCQQESFDFQMRIQPLLIMRMVLRSLLMPSSAKYSA